MCNLKLDRWLLSMRHLSVLYSANDYRCTTIIWMWNLKVCRNISNRHSLMSVTCLCNSCFSCRFVISITNGGRKMQNPEISFSRCTSDMGSGVDSNKWMDAANRCIKSSIRPCILHSPFAAIKLFKQQWVVWLLSYPVIDGGCTVKPEVCRHNTQGWKKYSNHFSLWSPRIYRTVS